MAQKFRLGGGPKPRIPRAAALLTAAFLLASPLAACDDAPKSPEDFLTRAEEFRAKGNLRASTVEIKNALQADPDNARARLLMGLNLLDVGAWSAAETTLERARNDGAQPYLILRPLARAWLALGKFDKVLGIAQPAGDMQESMKAAVLVLRGRALVGLRKRDDARKQYDEALRRDAKSYSAYLGLAGLEVADNKIEAAEKLLAKAKEIAADEADVLQFEGSFAAYNKNFKRSGRAFNTLVSRRPERTDYRIGLARAQLASDDQKSVVETLSPALKANPDLPQLNYLRALTAYRSKDYETTLVYGEKVLAVSSNHLPTILIFGAANYALGGFEQAVEKLSQYIAKIPSNVTARRILGAAQIRLAQPKKAVETLLPLTEGGNEDAQALGMIGLAAVQSGDIDAGSQFFERLVRLQPANARARSVLGEMRIARGDTDRGIADLKDAIVSDPSLLRGEYALIVNLIRLGKTDEAVKAAKQFQEKNPKEPMAYALEGTAHASAGRVNPARAAFLRALEIAPGHVGTSVSLSVLELRSGNKDEARRILIRAIAHHPDELRIMSSLAEIELQSGQPNEAIKWLEKSVNLHPKAVYPRVRLGQVHLQAGAFDKALAASQPGLRDHPENRQLLAVVGRTLVVARRYQEAVFPLRSLVGLEPKSVDHRFLLAEAYAGVRDSNGARKTLESILKIEPKNKKARIVLARMVVGLGDLATGNLLLSELQVEFPKDPLVYDIQGDLRLAQRRPREAAVEFKRVMSLDPSERVAMKLAKALWVTADRQGGVDVLQEWVAKNSASLRSRFLLGGLLRNMNRLEEARSEYAKIVKRYPENWLGRNELAWVLYRLKSYDNALKHAEKGVEIAPDNPVVIDTLGMILLEIGRDERAMNLLRRAYESLPNQPTVASHFAKALVKNGRKDEAKEVLAKALSGHKEFDNRKESEALMKQLRAN